MLHVCIQALYNIGSHLPFLQRLSPAAELKADCDYDCDK